MVLHGKPWPVEGPQGPPAAVGKHHYKPHYTNVHFSVPYGVALCSEGEHVDCDLSKTKDFIQHALDQRFGPGTAFLPELRFRMATAAMVPDAAHEPDGVRDGGGSDGDNDDGPSPPDDGPPPPSNEEKGCHVMWETSMADKTIGSGVLLSMMPGHGTVSLGDFTLDSTAVGTLSICDSESWHR